MADKGTLSWTNWRGKEETRVLNYVLDIRNHVGQPGWAWLVIAANPHLSVADLLRFLSCKGVERSRSWMARRRWMFQPDDTKNSPGQKPNRDGKDDRAIAIMRDNTRKSVRQLVWLLNEAKIDRSREWVRRHRCD